MKPLRRVAVLGAGTMGSRIAAHFANAGFPVDLLDIVQPGKFEDDLGRIRDCNWIVEAVSENLEVKRRLWRQVAALRTPGTIISTNTSGIPLARISEGFSDEFREHF